ncbi:MAG: hypothetical protein HS105_05990 [Chloracidobacterium sp.]|nr:hypothetical protein [Chloracidobacterium sp.]
MKCFRVVTVTLTRSRAEGLTEIAEQTLPPKFKKYFRFELVEVISGDDPARLFQALKV